MVVELVVVAVVRVAVTLAVCDESRVVLVLGRSARPVSTTDAAFAESTSDGPRAKSAGCSSAGRGKSARSSSQSIVCSVSVDGSAVSARTSSLRGASAGPLPAAAGSCVLVFVGFIGGEGELGVVLMGESGGDRSRIPERVFIRQAATTRITTRTKRRFE